MATISGAESFSHDGGDIGVLVIHGFTGSPVSMRPWADHLAASGYTVRLPLLPGHGTTWKDMSLTRWTDWYATVERSLIELTKTCRHVYIMGLSMGGTLTLRLAEEHADLVRGIVLVNPSVHTERKDAVLLPLLSKIIPSFPGVSNDIKKPGIDEGAYDRFPLKCAHSLSELWKITKADISKITCPTLLFHSKVDHVVEPSNAVWLISQLSDVRGVTLENSYHVATLDYDAELIFAGSVTFIEDVESR